MPGVAIFLDGHGACSCQAFRGEWSSSGLHGCALDAGKCRSIVGTVSFMVSRDACSGRRELDSECIAGLKRLFACLSLGIELLFCSRLKEFLKTSLIIIR